MAKKGLAVVVVVVVVGGGGGGGIARECVMCGVCLLGLLLGIMYGKDEQVGVGWGRTMPAEDCTCAEQAAGSFVGLTKVKQLPHPKQIMIELDCYLCVMSQHSVMNQIRIAPGLTSSPHSPPGV